MVPSLLSSAAALAVFSLANFGSGAPIRRATGAVRVLDTDFADPCIFNNGDGYYAFATSGNGVNIQVAQSPDFNTWTLSAGVDALPSPFPSWVASTPNTWAPDVSKLADGSYVMYFSASSSTDDTKHCVGVATSTSVGGPYQAQDAPLACPLDQGGAIDADGFSDGDNLYVVYKIDGNSLDSDGTTHPTPLMLQQVEADGATTSGDPIQLLDRDDGDGALIEAPSLVKGGDTYFLFFSSNDYSTPQYDVSYATAPALTGPYTKAQAPDAPFLMTGDASSAGDLSGPGGADLSIDGTKAVFHAFENGANLDKGRAMYTTGVSLSGNVASLA